MERRRFITLLGAGIAGFALEQAIPLGRVWSFPKKIVVPQYVTIDGVLGRCWGFEWSDDVTLVGTTEPFRVPQRFVVRDSYVSLDVDHVDHVAVRAVDPPLIQIARRLDPERA
jgi:hypothetical protein